MGVYFDRPPRDPSEPDLFERMVIAQQRTALALERIADKLDAMTATVNEDGLDTLRVGSYQCGS